MRSTAILVVLCLFGAAVAQSDYGVSPCDDTDFAWRWGNYTHACGCTSLSTCQTALCQQNVDVLLSIGDYNVDCDFAYSDIEACDGDSSISVANQAVVSAVIASYDYCAEECNDWAVGVYWDGWVANCTGCSDATSAECVLSNCAYNKPEGCATFGSLLDTCYLIGNDTVQTELADFATAYDCFSQDLCDGDLLQAQIDAWYAACDFCDPSSANYDDSVCTASTCQDETSECYWLWSSVNDCYFYTSDTDANYDVVQNAEALWEACYLTPVYDCSEAGVNAVLGNITVECDGDVCNAWKLDYVSCSESLDYGFYCYDSDQVTADQSATLEAYALAYASCDLTYSSSGAEWSTGGESSTGEWSWSGEGSTSEYQGSLSSSGQSSSGGTGFETAAASSPAASIVVVLASIVALLL